MKINNFFGRTTMFKKMLLLMTAVLFIMNGLVFAQSTLTIVDLPATGTDAAIGIDATKTYTHAFDFGEADEATINSVELFPAFYGNISAVWEDVSPQGYGFVIDDSRATVNIASHEGNDDVDTMADGNSVAMLRDMIYFSRATVGEGILLTLKDLVPGTEYSFRYYYRPWDPPLPRPITFKFDGPVDSAFVDTIRIDIDNDNPGAAYLDYTYTADDDDKTILFLCNDDNQGVHLYGITNEVMPGTGVNSKSSAKPSTWQLVQNYPNPFNPETTIDYQLSVKTHVSLKVFDINGHEVATLVRGEQSQGHYRVKFDGHNLPSGVYVYKLTMNEQTITKRMLLLK